MEEKVGSSDWKSLRQKPTIPLRRSGLAAAPKPANTIWKVPIKSRAYAKECPLRQFYSHSPMYISLIIPMGLNPPPNPGMECPDVVDQARRLGPGAAESAGVIGASHLDIHIDFDIMT